jgi:glycosyltransferase involved in cell wall biosynthesis
MSNAYSNKYSKKEFSIIIPAYNEEKRIIERLETLVNFFHKNMGNPEIIVITDGCTDKTHFLVSEFSKKHPQVKLLNFSKRLGKGGAIIEGLRRAEGNIIVITDADNSVAPAELYKLITESKNYDVVICSRYSNGACLLIKEPFNRFILGRAFNALVKLMFWRMSKIYDTQCGAKVVKRYVISKILPDLFITGFTFDVNLIYSSLRHGFTVKEVGITYKHIDDYSKVSKNLPRVALGMFFSLVKLRLYYSRFRPLLYTRTFQKLSLFMWNATNA